MKNFFLNRKGNEITTELKLRGAIYVDKLFHSNTLSYLHADKVFMGKINGVECQITRFSWLSYPGVGIFGEPFSVGKYFTNKMGSGKMGVWLCLDSKLSHRDKESGEIVAAFVGYKNECHFYDDSDLDIICNNFRKYIE